MKRDVSSNYSSSLKEVESRNVPHNSDKTSSKNLHARGRGPGKLDQEAQSGTVGI